MAELLFWLLILPVMSLIAALVLLREQIFDQKYCAWLKGFAGFFIELAEVYDHWHFWWAYALLKEMEELEVQKRVQLTYTPLLIDDSCPEMKEEEPECTKV